jgi:hypothetical protein
LIYVNGKVVSKVPDLYVDSSILDNLASDLDNAIPAFAEAGFPLNPGVLSAYHARHGSPIRSGVVAKPDTIHERWLSGEIASLEAIDELVESGMDFKEADKLVTTWIHNV